MMGSQETPARLFYDFCLDEHVPSDHLLIQAMIKQLSAELEASK